GAGPDADAQALEALRGDADAAQRPLALVHVLPDLRLAGGGALPGPLRDPRLPPLAARQLSRAADAGRRLGALLLRHRPPDRVARAEFAVGGGADESGDAADVPALRRLLQRRQLPRLDAPDRESAAADGAERRAARGDPRRQLADGDPART